MGVMNRITGRKSGGIHIKPSHRGLFTKAAHRAGKGVQEYAQEKKNSSDPALKKRAVFAMMAKRHFKPL